MTTTTDYQLVLEFVLANDGCTFSDILIPDGENFAMDPEEVLMNLNELIAGNKIYGCLDDSGRRHYHAI